MWQGDYFDKPQRQTSFCFFKKDFFKVKVSATLCTLVSI